MRIGWLESVTLALAALAIASTSGAQELRFFYCYVPDPASGTVYISPAMPIGPVAERAGYGSEFASYLQKQGRLAGDAQGYCAMRPTREAVLQAQSLLPRENCPECGGAGRFEGVAWVRGGVASPPPPAGLQIAGADTEQAGGIEILDIGKPLLLVMGNARTGRLSVTGPHSTPEALAASQARLPAGAGWKTLLTTSEPGHGAAICAREAGEVRFFVAHEQASFEEAARAARQFAQQNAVEPSTVELCGVPWELRSGEAVRQAGEGVVERIRQMLWDEVNCAPALDQCPDRPAPTSIGVRG